MHLVMLETNGNQRFIFSSPRLRDSVGASSLLTKLEQWTAHELLTTGGAAAWRAARGLPDGREPHESQWVSVSSGKVIFLVDSAQQAKDVIGAVTRTALAKAPGMDVSGVFIPLPAPSNPQESDTAYVTESALKEIHAEAARHALQRPPADARFSQLPFLARAKDSSMPASPPFSTRDEANDDRQDALSLASRVRRYRAYRARLDLLKKGVKRSSDLSDKQALLTRDPTMLAKKFSLRASSRWVMRAGRHPRRVSRGEQRSSVRLSAPSSPTRTPAAPPARTPTPATTPSCPRSLSSTSTATASAAS